MISDNSINYPLNSIVETVDQKLKDVGDYRYDLEEITKKCEISEKVWF